VSAGDIIVALVVAAGVSFDFTNGFHDTANAMATTIATGALPPKVAVGIAAVLNFAGAFISLSVAATVAEGIVESAAVTPVIILGGLIGAICWNLATWWFGIPSSSSHALIGGVVGATLVGAGSGAIEIEGIISKVIIPAAISPVLAGLLAAIGVAVIYLLIRAFQEEKAEREFRWLQVASSSMVALAHGTNDAQKTMGVISLALIANGSIQGGANFGVPTWVVIICATAIAAGTYSGGWRIIKTLGTKVVEVRPPGQLEGDPQHRRRLAAHPARRRRDLGAGLRDHRTARGRCLRRDRRRRHPRDRLLPALAGEPPQSE